MLWILIIIAAAAAGYGVHRLAIWAEHRGWIYYRNKRGPLGGFGMALIEATTPFAPEIEHAIEEQHAERVRADLAESGLGPHDAQILLDSAESGEQHSSSAEGQS